MHTETHTEEAEVISKLRTSYDRVAVQLCLAKLYKQVTELIANKMDSLQQYALLQVKVLLKPMEKEAMTAEIDALQLEEKISAVCTIGGSRIDLFAAAVTHMATKHAKQADFSVRTLCGHVHHSRSKQIYLAAPDGAHC